ncbi:uncharacterized protein CTRU02_207095 [Colletotrichum truncatum]|uniref:Uncharacterized protein n=1 Tax=Colletotrichum truncatum TaxID=5467 RepID=A0ACC3YZV7_COLTU
MPPTSQASHGSKYEPILVSSESTINLWSVAYKEIDEETKNWIGEFDMNCEDRIQAKQLTILVRKKEDFYKSEESGVTVGEKRILWRDYASRVVAGATTIGDISVQFAPAPAAPVWSALKVLLKTHVAQLDQVTAILGCADRVLSIVRRGQVVGELLQRFEQAERQRSIDHISNISVDNTHVVKRDYRTKETFIDRYRADPRALDNNDRRRLNLASAWSTAAMNDEGFAYFYCDRNDSGRRNAKSILSSYIVQLLTASRHRDKWHSQLRPFCGASDATRRSLGLSDCKQIVTENNWNISSIFVSSRPEIEFTEMVKLFSFIQIRTAENMGDIKKYIDAAPEKAVSPPVWSRNDI